MAQSSSHTLFACLQMPDALSGLIQGIVHERVNRNCNWPIDPSRSAPGAESFNIESLPPSCPASMTALSPTLASPFGSARDLALLARAVTAAMRIASSGSSTPLSGVHRAGWKARAPDLFQSLSLSPQASTSLKPICQIGRLTLGSSPQHALHPSHILNGALRAPHACIRL